MGRLALASLAIAFEQAAVAAGGMFLIIVRALYNPPVGGVVLQDRCTVTAAM